MTFDRRNHLNRKRSNRNCFIVIRFVVFNYSNSSDMNFHSLARYGALLFFLSAVHGTMRYYDTILSYGSGDTMIRNYQAHLGPLLPHFKWIVECLDGEAMVGIQDENEDFNRLIQTWCKFMFPLKPPTNGLYPYYPRCHTLNLTSDFHCYVPTNHAVTINTFVTAIRGSHPRWFENANVIAPYKCCKAPLGYYIDYISCYYMPTHDVYFEYYDAINQIFVYCAQGYVMTGIAKKRNPYTAEFRYDWIQCCRVGMGLPVQAHRPPVTYMPSGAAAYYAPRTMLPEIGISNGYASQYRSSRKSSDDHDEEEEDKEGKDGDEVTLRAKSNATKQRRKGMGGDLRRDATERLLIQAGGGRSDGDIDGRTDPNAEIRAKFERLHLGNGARRK
ncbi:hypothetical protein BV898_10650 [Hypsibius exemplaris]|uniref:Uncharacterized protein n=1 Tax=Hypsibius exemplaris TaxID=2072580 RepID=A0A1W0WIZ9_HYPEX|nr:hypothetical protein BV898_10650 [Hypsibius exemplaris]